MKLSTRGRYGLRALIDLAAHCQQEAVSISSIAARQGISESYLEQLVRKLKKSGLVVSSRGVQGGYRLAKPAAEISVGDILRSLEGNLKAVECPGLQEEKGCKDADFCVTKYVWQRINDSITDAVDGITLEQLVAEDEKARKKKNYTNIKCEN